MGRGRALNGIGSAYQGLGDLDKALDYHRRSLEIFQTAEGPLSEARALNDMGEVFERKGQYEEARQCHQKSLALREKTGNRQAQSTSLINLGQLCMSTGDIARALQYLKQGLAIAEDVKSKPKIYQAHEALAQVYEKSGDLAVAMSHHKAYHRVREEVLGEETRFKLTNLQVGFEVEKSEKEAEIERLRNVELKSKNEQLEQLLAELKATQTQLVQSEKMAALGSPRCPSKVCCSCLALRPARMALRTLWRPSLRHSLHRISLKTHQWLSQVQRSQGCPIGPMDRPCVTLG